MKGGKDEEKVMGPLFPRLHVKDAEKGGPRAPPRNKMALYEQLSIPSQRLQSAGSSTLHPQDRIGGTLVPSASSSKGAAHERKMYSPFYRPSPTPANSAEKVLSHFSDRMNLNGTIMEVEGESIKTASYRAVDITGNFSSTADSSSFHPLDSSNPKNYCGKEDGFGVPIYAQPPIASCSNRDGHSGGDGEKSTPSPAHLTATNTKSFQKSTSANYYSPFQLQGTLDKPLKRTNTTVLKLRQSGRNLNQQKPIVAAATKDCMEKSVTSEKIAETVKHSRVSLNEEHVSGSINEHENAQLLQEVGAGLGPKNDMCDHDVSVEPRFSAGNSVSQRENGSRFQRESHSIQREPHSQPSQKISKASPDDVGNHNAISEERIRYSLQLGDVDGNDDVSETSMVDFISGLEISPDDVVGVMGQKHFWKARRVIVNQQRVFAVQVFELHRLIKVQKMIAGSPDLLLKDYPYFGRPSTKIPVEVLPSNYIAKIHLQMCKPKDDSQSQKPSQSTEIPTESAIGRTPPVNEGVIKGVASQISSYGPYSGNPPPLMPVAADNKHNEWCFHPPGNQWLVPVMSPSEGLVYKPYAGPCTPTPGFMAPVYSGCGPVSLPPVTAYGALASHQQPGVGVPSGTTAIAPCSFTPPYGLPVMSPIIPTSAIEQANPSGGAQPHGHAEQISMREVNFKLQSGSSCNMSKQNSKACSCCVWKLPTSKDSKVQGCTASSPADTERSAGHDAGREVLPLFPLAPSMEGSDQTQYGQSSDQQTHVIKVVPHNRRLATKSAERIFQSIQEERRQYDSL